MVVAAEDVSLKTCHAYRSTLWAIPVYRIPDARQSRLRSIAPDVDAIDATRSLPHLCLRPWSPSTSTETEAWPVPDVRIRSDGERVGRVLRVRGDRRARIMIPYSLVMIGLAAGTVTASVYRRSRLRRAFLYAFPTLPFLASVWICTFPPRCPMIVFAIGHGGGLHVLEPLKQNQWRGWLTTILRADITVEDYVHANWDGQYLYVHGWCCGKPASSSRGSFVLAMLPNGLAYAVNESNTNYTHLAKPRYVSNAQLLGTTLCFTLAVWSILSFGPCMASRFRRLLVTPPNHCQNCGYNLTGNTSGTCPECGTVIQESGSTDS